MNRIARSGVFVLVVTLAFAAGPGFAQNPPPEQPQPQPPAATAPVFQSDQDAQSTRQQLFMVLQEYPPTVRRVLQLDPALMDRPDYLAPYPRLLAFLQQHPEIRRNPSFFLGSPNGPDFDRRPSDALPEILAGTGFFIGFITILAVATSLLRQLIEYRRWLRQSRVQTEVHTKILDRLQSNEDLLAYVQTPAGRHFLESTPIATDGELRSVGAPLGRILWSVQLGVVLVTLGIGLSIAQAQVDGIEEMAPAFSVMGVVAVALGVGAVISAIAAYVLSARLGLLPAQKQLT